METTPPSSDTLASPEGDALRAAEAPAAVALQATRRQGSAVLPLGQTARRRAEAKPAVAARTREFPSVDDVGLIAASKLRAMAFLEDLREPAERSSWILIAAFTGLLVYSYWPGLMNAASSWDDAQYSHGWLVPMFGVAMLFWWRQPIAQPVPTLERMAGLGLLVASFGLRLLMARYRIVTIDMYSFVPALAGVFLMIGGWSLFRWAWAPLAFLIFMYPLPDEATRYLLGPLQTLATIVSTFALQTLGMDAFRDGNRIIVGEMQLGVVDACSGLRMLTIFIALSVAIAMLGKREWWENAVIMASSIPIALLVNSVRITVTGLLYQVASSETAEMVFHDLAGWIMMPMALALLFVEQKMLASLFLDEQEVSRVPMSGGLR
ncbi:MAG: exosortase/archaeosortase family protein [Pirellulales bacterium]|jgi:exosortase